MRSGASSSSSCAQTPDEHSTDTVPADSARGWASAATVGADGVLPDPLDPGQQGLGTGRADHPLEGRRQRSRLAPAHGVAPTAGWSDPRSTSITVVPASPASGTCASSVVVEQALAALAQEVGQERAARGVELGHDVVQEHQRRRAALVAQDVALGEQERQERDPLLALGPVLAQGAARRAPAAGRRGAGRAR